MSIQEIIESGMLEEFVFGNPSQTQITQVESWMSQFPEIKVYVSNLEETATTLATENAVSPPPSWKEEIMSQATQQSSLGTIQSSTTNWWAIAASFLIGTIITGGILISKLYTIKTDLVEAKQQYQHLSEQCEKDKVFYAANTDILNLIQHTQTKSITLKAQDLNSSDQITVYWNDTNGAAIANIQNLRQLESEETYQIWADVDGVMTSLGLLEDQSNQFIALQYVEHAESLNITIEPKGGSEHPTVSRLVMSANV